MWISLKIRNKRAFCEMDCVCKRYLYLCQKTSDKTFQIITPVFPCLTWDTLFQAPWRVEGLVVEQIGLISRQRTNCKKKQKQEMYNTYIRTTTTTIITATTTTTTATITTTTATITTTTSTTTTTGGCATSTVVSLTRNLKTAHCFVKIVRQFRNDTFHN